VRRDALDLLRGQNGEDLLGARGKGDAGGRRIGHEDLALVRRVAGTWASNFWAVVKKSLAMEHG
jgi:hypothetical protein